MKTRLTRLLLLISTVALAAALAVGPAFATEAEGTGGEEGPSKIHLPERPRDRVGLLLLGAAGVAALVALDNARRQLRGERKQATGEFRWR